MDYSEFCWNQWVYGKLDWGLEKIERGAWATELWEKSIIPLLSSKGFSLVLPKKTIIRKFLWFWKTLSENSYDTIDYINAIPIPRSKSYTIPLPTPKVPIKIARGEEHTLAALHRKKLGEYRNIFDYKLDHNFWQGVFNYYEASHGAFDDTWTGRMLRADLPNFIWAYIDLRNSGTIEDYEDEQAEIEAFYKQIESSHLTLEELDKMRKRGELDPDYVYDKHE
jgi:hypothetical protein